MGGNEVIPTLQAAQGPYFTLLSPFPFLTHTRPMCPSEFSLGLTSVSPEAGLNPSGFFGITRSLSLPLPPPLHLSFLLLPLLPPSSPSLPSPHFPSALGPRLWAPCSGSSGCCFCCCCLPRGPPSLPSPRAWPSCHRGRLPWPPTCSMRTACEPTRPGLGRRQWRCCERRCGAGRR